MSHSEMKCVPDEITEQSGGRSSVIYASVHVNHSVNSVTKHSNVIQTAMGTDETFNKWCSRHRSIKCEC